MRKEYFSQSRYLVFVIFLLFVLLLTSHSYGQDQNDVINAQTNYREQTINEERAKSNYDIEKGRLDSLVQFHSSAALSQEISNKESAWNRKRSDRETLTRNLFRYSADYQKAEKYVESYTRRLGRVSKRLEHKKAFIAKIDGGAGSFSQEIRQLVTEYPELGHRMIAIIQGGFKTQKTFLKNYKNSLSHDIQQWQRMYDDLKNQVNTNTSTQERAQVDYEKVEGQLDDINREVGRLERALQLKREDYYTAEAFEIAKKADGILGAKITSLRNQIDREKRDKISENETYRRYTDELEKIHTGTMEVIPTFRKSRTQLFLLDLALAHINSGASIGGERPGGGGRPGGGPGHRRPGERLRERLEGRRNGEEEPEVGPVRAPERQPEEENAKFKKVVQKVQGQVSQAYDSSKRKMTSYESSRKNQMSYLVSHVQTMIDTSVELDRLENELVINIADEETNNAYYVSLEGLKGTFDAQELSVSTASGVWSQEKKNTETVYNRFVSLAENFAVNKGKAEGQTDGDSVGAGEEERIKKLASKVGSDAGDEDGRKLKWAEGFRFAWANGATDPKLKAYYQKGFGLGEKSANAKAQSEDLPTAYNALAKVYTENFKPSHEPPPIDISEEISPDPGGDGEDLTLLHKDVLTVPAPDVTEPNLPQPNAPTISSASIGVPEGSPSSGTCDFISVTNVKEYCNGKYLERYNGAFSSAYKAQIKQFYDAYAKVSYNETVNLNYPESYNRGLQEGAEGKGLMDGFKRQHPIAQKAATSEGERLYVEDFKKGHLIVGRGKDAYLEEENEDGIFSPGEVVKLTLTVDNYGKMASPKAGFRVRVTSYSGLSDLSTETRDLPAFDADHRITMKGVLTAKVTSSRYVNAPIVLKGVLEKRVGQEYKPIDQFSVGEEVKAPISLEGVEYGGVLKLNEENEAKFTLKNISTKRFEGGEFKIGNIPVYSFKFKGENTTTVEIPPMEPNEQKIIDLNLEPSTWSYGGYIQSLFRVSSTSNPSMAYTWRTGLKDDRETLLFLTLDPKGKKQIHAPVLTAKAGGYVEFYAFKYPNTANTKISVGEHSENIQRATNTISTTGSSLRFYYRLDNDFKPGDEAWIRAYLLTYNYQTGKWNKLLHGIQIQVIGE